MTVTAQKQKQTGTQTLALYLAWKSRQEARHESCEPRHAL